MKKTYYGLVAQNGLAVYDDWLQADQAKDYLVECKEKEYSSQKKAMEDTIMRYNDMVAAQEDIAFFNEDSLTLNWTIYRKNL